MGVLLQQVRACLCVCDCVCVRARVQRPAAPSTATQPSTPHHPHHTQVVRCHGTMPWDYAYHTHATHKPHTYTHNTQVVPADYAYVLHTANPVTGTAGQMFGEVVVGMGEALVGNYPGRCALP